MRESAKLHEQDLKENQSDDEKALWYLWKTILHTDIHRLYFQQNFINHTFLSDDEISVPSLPVQILGSSSLLTMPFLR